MTLRRTPLNGSAGALSAAVERAVWYVHRAYGQRDVATGDVSAAVLTDADLMLRTGQGDHDAFTLLVERHEQWARTLIARIVGNLDEAEDIAQEVFLKVWIEAPQWTDRGSVRGWLARTLTRRSIDFLRRCRPDQLNEGYDPPDPAASALDRLQTEDCARRLAVLVMRLPARQRTALALFYGESLSLREAAQAMDLGPKAFESLLQRARARLRALSMEEQ